MVAMDRHSSVPVTLLSVATASVLVTIKLIAWISSGSVALLASMADSGLDLVASLVTFFAVRYASAPPDDEHRFGHGKAEAFASLIQAGLVFSSAALIGQEAIRHLMEPHPLKGEFWAVIVMVSTPWKCWSRRGLGPPGDSVVTRKPIRLRRQLPLRFLLRALHPAPQLNRPSVHRRTRLGRAHRGCKRNFRRDIARRWRGGVRHTGCQNRGARRRRLRAVLARQVHTGVAASSAALQAIAIGLHPRSQGW